MHYCCTHMSTVGVKGLNTYWRRRYRARPSVTADVYCSCYWCTSVCHHHQLRCGKNCSNTISSVAESRPLMTGMAPGRPVVLSPIPFRHTQIRTSVGTPSRSPLISTCWLVHWTVTGEPLRLVQKQLSISASPLAVLYTVITLRCIIRRLI